VVYACADLSSIIASPYGDKKLGDTVTYDYDEMNKEYTFYDDWVW
jgi:hypothetical protein